MSANRPTGWPVVITLMRDLVRTAMVALSRNRPPQARPPTPRVATSRQAERSRKQVASIVEEIYFFGFVYLVVSAGLLAVIGLTFYLDLWRGMVEQSSWTPPARDMTGYVGWLREQRDGWDTAALLGIPTALVLPAFLAILLVRVLRAPHAPLQVQEMAWLEVLDQLLRSGLCVAAGFSLLGAIPPEHGIDVPTQALGVGLAYVCLVLAQLLKPRGPDRVVRIARAQAELMAFRAARRTLGGRIAATAPRAARLLRRTPTARLQVLSLTVLLAAAGPVMFCWLGLLAADRKASAAIGLTAVYTPLIVATFGLGGALRVRRRSRQRLGVDVGPPVGLAASCFVLALFVAGAVLTGSTVLAATLAAMLASALLAPALVNRLLLGGLVDYHTLRWHATVLENRITSFSGYGD